MLVRMMIMVVRMMIVVRVMVRMMIMVVRMMMIVVRMMVAKKDENLETKILEAAQATRYPPEADHRENEEYQGLFHAHIKDGYGEALNKSQMSNVHQHSPRQRQQQALHWICS